jgi:hypothetical protein
LTGNMTDIIDSAVTFNWLLLVVGGLVAVMTTSMSFYLGVMAGGLIVAVNFHLLKRTVTQTICPDQVSQKGRSLMGQVLVKYFIRFAVSGIVIFLLISNHMVHPLGLLAGLSLVVASVFLVTLFAVTRLIFKEAV